MLKIERDKVYLDGLDRKIRVVCIDASPEFPIIGVGSAGEALTYTAEGRYFSDQSSVFDLVHEVKEKKVRYINIYPNNEVSHNSRQTADDCAIHDRLARIRVEYEEGRLS